MNFLSLKIKFNTFFKLASFFRLSVFLLLCLILGGTSQDIVDPKLPIYLASLIIIGCCLSVVKIDSKIWRLKTLVILWCMFVIVQLAYLIPLPPSIWTELNGRDTIVQGFEIIGAELPWLPLSVTPEKTLFSLFDFLPSLALILLMGTVVTPREFKVALWSLGAFVIISVVIGMMQVGGATTMYYYENTNQGSAVGFFSNANHFGIMLLMSVPLLACLADQNTKAFTFSIIAILAAILGIGLSGSLASYLLIIPVLAATLFVGSRTIKMKKLYMVGVFISLISALLFDMFIWNNMQSEILDKFTSIDTSTRRVLFDNTYQITKEFFPFGSGLGSFSDVYRLVEEAGRRTIPHAHNDYIEIISEMGVIGISGLIFIFFWLGKNIYDSSFSQGAGRNSAKFMAIAIVAIGIHSIFDYPLRTIAIMTLTVFVICSINLLNKDIKIIEN